MFTLSLAASRWKFCDSASQDWLPASVPGCVHTDLLSAKKILDPFFGTNELELQWIEQKNWEYQTTFKVSNDLLAMEEIELVADGLDTIATVTLNGATVGATENMFIGYRWAIRDLLIEGVNDLRICFKSAVNYIQKTRTDFTPPKEFCDPVGNSARIRKQPCQFGWDWGPRLVSAGIWRDIRIEAWNRCRLAHVHVRQEHHQDGFVELDLNLEFAGRARRFQATAVCRLDGVEVAKSSSVSKNLKLRIERPQLWWPAGQGEQSLYDLEVTVRDFGGAETGSVKKRIGLRTIALDRHADRWGETFQFLVNGRPIFIKGANWIPAHSFVTSLTREAYARDLRAAVAANMNCVRLWGGGVYESEDFYDLCDQLGLLVWHDFMFACTLYPSDAAFVRSVREEAVYQVKRIHHRACLALWCGNNELVQLNGEYLQKTPALLRGYRKIFHEVLPAIVSAHDGTTGYWPTSEWRGGFESGHALGEKSGDSHFWDVWHARHPVKDYEKWAFRFCSEFGMQSYSSSATNATFCSPEDRNIFGPVMENHQKNRSGNQVILDYVSRRYRLPKSQDDLIYLSQLNQAFCMQTGVEHFRRLMPRCMGTLYWQLNDCWPCASWSSIEFTGRWKALHHAARRFYAPALVSAFVPGTEETTIGNYRRSSINKVQLYTVYDGVEKKAGSVVWELWHFDGRVLATGNRRVKLRPGESLKQCSIDLASFLETHGRDHIYLRIALEVEEAVVSEQTVFLAPPRFLALPRAKITPTARRISKTQFAITFTSAVYHHAVEFDLGKPLIMSSDNYFDLYPNRDKTVLVDLTNEMSRKEVLENLRVRSLVDSYD